VQPDEIAVLESRVQEVADQDSKKKLSQPNYVLDVISKDSASGQWYLSRKVYFNRTDLLPYRQLLFNRQGDVATDARYNNFKDFQDIPFPMNIQVIRLQEEYTIGLKVTKLTLNKPLKPDQFQLTPPPGAQIVNLDGSEGIGSMRSAEAPR
jgi:Domain of unknown function (DUF4292)